MSVLSASNNNRKIQSKEVAVGNMVIGGNRPVLIQSMTTTKTLDTNATVDQIVRLADVGCEMVRITTQNIKEAQNLNEIKNTLIKKGYGLPLIADVHFNPKVAEIAAQIVEKVRINPGNYVDRNNLRIDFTEEEYYSELVKIEQKLSTLIDICKKNNTAIRIGTNHGSLSNRILAKYGNTPEGMVESAIEFVQICMNLNFEHLVLSMKASNVRVMIEANKLLVERMIKNGYYYPVHLGITEAGDGADARIKSAAGIGNLLMNGIGDTIRVSLTEIPENEIPVSRQLVELFGKKKDKPPIINAEEIIIKNNNQLIKSNNLKPPYVISQGFSEIADFLLDQKNILHGNEGVIETETISDSVREFDTGILKLNYSDLEKEKLLIKAASEFSYLYDLHQSIGICITNKSTSPDTNTQLALDILQAMGLRFSKTEFIACPSCGRTKFDIQDHLKRVKEKTAHLKGIRIAIMGCIVNGPGEMADSDYGYVGSGTGKVNLYKGSTLVYANLNENIAVDTLISLLKDGGDWKD